MSIIKPRGLFLFAGLSVALSKDTRSSYRIPLFGPFQRTYYFLPLGVISYLRKSALTRGEYFCLFALPEGHSSGSITHKYLTIKDGVFFQTEKNFLIQQFFSMEPHVLPWAGKYRQKATPQLISLPKHQFLKKCQAKKRFTKLWRSTLGNERGFSTWRRRKISACEIPRAYHRPANKNVRESTLFIEHDLWDISQKLKLSRVWIREGQKNIPTRCQPQNGSMLKTFSHL